VAGLQLSWWLLRAIFVDRVGMQAELMPALFLHVAGHYRAVCVCRERESAWCMHRWFLVFDLDEN